MKTEQGKPIYFPAHYTRAPDGTRIRYFDSEEPLPAIIFANGLGGPASVWAPYVARWRGRLRVLTWDYRGLYGSVLPGPQADLGISAHCGDLLAVLNAAGIDQAALLGWSMGVQVGLEFYSQNPKRLSHLALINGTHGRPLGGVPLPFSSVALPPLVRGARRVPGWGRKLLTQISRSPFSYAALRASGLIAATFDRERFKELVREFESVDLDVYFHLLQHLHAHDARKHLALVKIPTLVMTGTRDVLTPPWFARAMAEEIAHAEFFVVPRATHYAAAEYPEIVATRIEHFLQKSQLENGPLAAGFANPESDS